ncbi:MAG: NUDIX domain-containing protein [Rickettsiaceae bacterium]|nr:NUDIX domain-containing protein [Rickettsiaceae bacterium]
MNDKDRIHALSRAVIIDQGHILLCRTLDLKINFYFLPGGHIEHEESAKESLFREIMEETGCSCEIKRFLGCLEYSFKPGHNSICHNHEYNFIFEVQGVDLKLDKNISSPEKQIELVWKPLDQLSKIDFRAEPLRLLIPKWLSGNSELFQSEML